MNRQSSRKVFLPILIIAGAMALLALIVALYFGLQNSRGRHAWMTQRAQLTAAGVPVDYAALLPPPILDDQNFAATPFIESWFHETNRASQRGDADSAWRDDYQQARKAVVASTTKDSVRQFMDLAEWANAFQGSNTSALSRNAAAQIILKGFESSAVHLAELRGVSHRPLSRYPVRYNLENPLIMLLPHLINIRATANRLQLKACAELAAGRSDRALEDIDLMFRLIDSLKSEPILISYLVRMACINNGIQPVWEGLAEHRWTAPQLEHFQEEFSRLDFVADIRPALDAERAMGLLYAEQARKKGLNYLLGLNDPGVEIKANRITTVAGWFVPSGWYYQEAVNYSRLFDVLTANTYDVTNNRIFPDRVEANSAILEREFDGLGSMIRQHKYLARMMIQPLSKVPERAAKGQIMVDQAALACALERYRLAEGSYPQSLEALAPRFIRSIPHDPITGEAYKYRRTSKGGFTLYSVWWNQMDDGGTPAEKLEGDIVWSYNP